MSANSSASASRPCALTVYWNRCSIGRRRGADLARRHDRVLVANRVDEIHRRHPEARQPVRVHPHAHPVAEVRQDVGAPDARHARQRILEVDGRKVRKEHLVVGTVRGKDGDQHQHVGAGLLGPDAGAVHFFGKLARALGDPVLHIHRRLIGVGADGEGHVQAVAAAVGAVGAHVEHLVDAVDLALDRRGNSFLEGIGAGPGELGADADAPAA